MALSEQKKNAVKKKVNEFLKRFADKKGEKKKGIDIGFMADNEKLGLIERQRTGIIGFDVLTGGGLAKGKINQIWGPPGCGKSTLMLKATATGQKTIDDFLAAYLNNERTLDRDYAEFLGVSLSDLIVAEMSTTEESADLVNFLADPESGVDFVAFDTIQALSPEGELVTAKGQEKSVSDNTMALMPRAWSQFLRMYTSKNLGMTLLLGSQVRMDLGGFMAKEKETGGNAIKHYNILTVQMNQLSIQGAGNWPYTIASASVAPPNSFPIQLTIQKAKMRNRYKGNKLKIYFYKGQLEHKFNVLAIAKDLGIFDGRSFKYTVQGTVDNVDGEHEVEIRAKGFMDFYNKVSDEVVDYMESLLMNEYTKVIMGQKEIEKETENAEIED
jgi:recombination protein RecA